MVINKKGEEVINLMAINGYTQKTTTNKSSITKHLIRSYERRKGYE